MFELKHLFFILIALTWFEDATIFNHNLIISYGLIITTIWLILNLKKIIQKEITFTKPGFYLISGLLFLLAWSTLSLNWSEITDICKERVFNITAVIGLTIILLDQFRRENDWITTYKILVTAGLVSSFLVIEQAFSGVYRPVGYISPDPNFTAMRIITLVPLTYYWAKSSENTLRLLLTVSILIPFLAIISTGSRAGISVLLIISLIIIFQELKSNDTKKMLITFLVMLGIGALLLSTIIHDPLQPGITRFENLVDTIKGDISPDGSIQERYNLLIGGIRMFFDHPILGVGLGDFRVLSMDYGAGWDDEAHNTYLEIATELGIIGIGIFLGLVSYILIKYKKLEKTYSNNPLQTFITGCKIAYISILINFLFLTAFSDRRFYILMAFAVAMLGREQLSIKSFMSHIKELWKKNVPSPNSQ
jgi:O-antigen ligase